MPRRSTRSPTQALWTLAPILGAPLAHAPVLRFDLLRSLKRPIDGGRALGGRRIPNSFAKRRLGLAPGGHGHGPAGVVVSIVAQADFVLAACLVLAPVHRMTAREAGTAFAVVAAIHVPINLVGYALGARDTPI
jgi:CDP-archaeol synthase